MAKRVRFEELPKTQQLWLAGCESTEETILETGKGEFFQMILAWNYNPSWTYTDTVRADVVLGLLAQGAIGIRKNVPKEALKALGIKEE